MLLLVLYVRLFGLVEEIRAASAPRPHVALECLGLPIRISARRPTSSNGSQNLIDRERHLTAPVGLP